MVSLHLDSKVSMLEGHAEPWFQYLKHTPGTSFLFALYRHVFEFQLDSPFKGFPIPKNMDELVQNHDSL